MKEMYFLPQRADLYELTTYPEERIQAVWDVARIVIGDEQEEVIKGVLMESGTFKRSETPDQVRQELLALYDRFGGLRGSVIGYVGLFRTKRHIETNTKMDPARHRKLVTEILELFESRKLEYRRDTCAFTEEVFQEALDITVNRKLVALNNHNYLKAVLMSTAQRATTSVAVGKGNGRRGTNEGY